MNRIPSLQLGALASLLIITAGCADQIDVQASSGASAGSGSSTQAGSSGAGGSSTSSGGGGATCNATALPGLVQVALGPVTSATFVDGFLHVDGPLNGGAERYAVLQLAGGAGFVVDTPIALDGSAALVPAGKGRHVRLRATDASTAIDLVDTSNPAKPSLATTFTVSETVPPAFRGVFSVIDDDLIACFRPAPDADAALSRVWLGAATSPVPIPPSMYTQPCGGLSAHDGGAARGRTWIAWGTESDLLIFDVTSGSVDHLADYFYNPSGVHAYGAVRSAATDGSRIAFDIGNENRFFLYDLGSEDQTITHVYLGVSGPKRLLAVVDKIAYLATPHGVRAYDITTVPGQSTPDDYTPPLLDFHADVDFGSGLATLLSSDARHLAVVDAEGVLYVIPLDRSGPVAPLSVYLDAPPSALDGCGP